MIPIKLVGVTPSTLDGVTKYNRLNGRKSTVESIKRNAAVAKAAENLSLIISNLKRSGMDEVASYQLALQKGLIRKY